jgi:hypothetical protein
VVLLRNLLNEKAALLLKGFSEDSFSEVAAVGVSYRDMLYHD